MTVLIKCLKESPSYLWSVYAVPLLKLWLSWTGCCKDIVYFKSKSKLIPALPINIRVTDWLCKTMISRSSVLVTLFFQTEKVLGTWKQDAPALL